MIALSCVAISFLKIMAAVKPLPVFSQIFRRHVVVPDFPFFLFTL
jgi:hypothetical protein